MVTDAGGGPFPFSTADCITNTFATPPLPAHTHTPTRFSRKVYSNNAIYWQAHKHTSIVDNDNCWLSLFSRLPFSSLYFIWVFSAAYAFHCPIPDAISLNLFNLYLLWSKWQFIVICIYSWLNAFPFPPLTFPISIFFQPRFHVNRY